MDKQKSYLVEALAKKGLIMCELLAAAAANTESATASVVSVDEIIDIYNEIVKFVESSDAKVHSIFHIYFNMERSRFMASIWLHSSGGQVLHSPGSSAKSLRTSHAAGVQAARRQSH